MTERKAKLEKALAFDDEKASNAAVGGAQIIFNNQTLKFREAAHWENSRLAPLHAALVSAVENLEDIRAWCRDRTATDGTIYAIGLSRSTEAIAKIDEALEGMGGE